MNFHREKKTWWIQRRENEGQIFCRYKLQGARWSDTVGRCESPADRARIE